MKVLPSVIDFISILRKVPPMGGTEVWSTDHHLATHVHQEWLTIQAIQIPTP